MYGKPTTLVANSPPARPPAAEKGSLESCAAPPRRGARAIGLANRLVKKGEARREAERLALELAALPRVAMLSDRLSLPQQWNFPEDDAICREIAGSAPAMRQGLQSGAQRFASGSGRHGEGVGRLASA